MEGNDSRMRTVLIVDDNQQNLYMLQMLLTASGFHVEGASNGAEALEKARRTPPAMIVSDILMPVMDGFTLCRAWKQDERLRNIPFIFYTATYTDPKDEQFALGLGADKFIVKPVEPDTFLTLLEGTWNTYQAGKAVALPQARAEVVQDKLYNSVLIRKLEQKMLELEQANRILESDIADRAAAEAQRLEMERRLLHAQKLESLGVLAGGIAHDFNNLLMAVIGNLDLGLLALSATSAARPYIERGMQASRRAADLTRQILAYSGKGRFVVTRMDLSELVRENTDLFQASIPRNVSVDLRLAHEPVAIEADAGQIQQVVMNLITNASEAIGEQVGSITVNTASCHFDDEYLKMSRLGEKPPAGRFAYVEVSDTGCGMDEPTQRRLFEPFFTTKYTGRGLGMATILGIVRGHKGAIMVESAVGQGSRIRVLFPAAEAFSAVMTGADTVSPGQSAPMSSLRTVLVVDDEEAIRDVCATFVTTLGFNAITASNGDEALRIFQSHREGIGCVILDVTMPRMNGTVVLQELKRLQPDVSVILSSGYDERETTRHFAGLGLAGFLQKPYTLADLKSTIEPALERANRRSS